MNHYPFLRVANVMRGRLDLREVHEIELFDGELEKFRLRASDLLVVEGNGSPAQIGRAARWQGEIEDCVHQNHLIRVRPSGAIDSRYLTHYWNASRTTEYLRSVASSTSGLYVLTAAKVRSVSIPLPPLREQRRIVAAIEQQFSRLDAGVAALERAWQNLKRMRGAVLQAAVSGTLIETDLSTWEMHRLADVALIASGQTPRSLELADHGPIPFYKVGDMNAAEGEFMAASRGYIDPPAAKRFGLHIRPAGTVVFPKRGGAIATNKKRILREPSAYDLNTMGLVPSADIDSRFLYLWIRSIDLNRLADGSNVPQINHGDLSNLKLCVPPRHEQDRVVATADAALSLIDDLEVALSHAEIRSRRFRSSILGAAFSGKLVTPDASDEPASVLLERVEAERTASNRRRPGLSRRTPARKK
jgi:type I restriction enzyme S subunit